MPFDGVPFIIIGRKQLECRYGRVHRSRQRPDHSRSVSSYRCDFVLSLSYPSKCYVQLLTLRFLEHCLSVTCTLFCAIQKNAVVRNRLQCTTCCCKFTVCDYTPSCILLYSHSCNRWHTAIHVFIAA